jgi:MFS family permease
LAATPKHILPLIVFSQLAGTSLWFAGNAILPALSSSLNLPAGALAAITSTVQFGFICGTLVFALLSLADRISPSRLFFGSAIIGALINSSIAFLPLSYTSLLLSRFMTGFLLAGIYPVGMKLASDWYDGKLGKALGFLVGALVLGTATPHLLRFSGSDLGVNYVLWGTSILAALGGLSVLLFVGDGPNCRKASEFKPWKIWQVFKKKDFRASAFGYFGHMWELYAFWAFIPVIVGMYNQKQGLDLDESLWSFLVIAIGALGCVFGGLKSNRYGSAKVALGFVMSSGVLCLLSPIMWFLPTPFFLIYLLFWGFAVTGDSPQFSTLNAQTVPKELIGTALTLVICIGFFITIISIQLVTFLKPMLPEWAFLLILLPGPLFGSFHIFKISKNT